MLKVATKGRAKAVQSVRQRVARLVGQTAACSVAMSAWLWADTMAQKSAVVSVSCLAVH